MRQAGKAYNEARARRKGQGLSVLSRSTTLRRNAPVALPPGSAANRIRSHEI